MHHKFTLNNKLKICLLNCRWDLQRSREQAAYEKLKEKEKAAEVSKEENTDTVESFYPTLDDSKLH
jgi:hypothetical protein